MKNIVWIEKNPMYKRALEDWEMLVKKLVEIDMSLSMWSANLKNEIYQLVGFFTVFQGVVLTAETQMTQSIPHTTCRKVWSPVLLTVLAWFVTSIGIFLKLRPIVDIGRERKLGDYHRQEAAHRAQALRSQGPKFVFGNIKEWRTWEIPNRFIPTYFVWIMIPLTTFTGVFIASYFLILCDRGLAPISFPSTPSN